MTVKLILGALLLLAAFFAFQRWSGGGEKISATSFVDRPAHSVVVDVRTPDEFATGHVTGAVNMNLFDDFEGRMAGFDRERPVYLYCASGHRSGRAASILTRLGFKTVVNAGGYGELAAAGAETATGPE